MELCACVATDGIGDGAATATPRSDECLAQRRCHHAMQVLPRRQYVPHPMNAGLLKSWAILILSPVQQAE
jgi:hypothetical protein